MIQITIQSVADADYFKIKKYPAEFFDAKPKAYELSRGGLNEDTAEIPVTAKNVHNGSALFTNVAVADIEVNGETYETYEELSAALTPILFKKGGGSGGGGTGIQSIQEGDNVSIDNTDPLNPVINAEMGEIDLSGLANKNASNIDDYVTEWRTKLGINGGVLDFPTFADFPDTGDSTSIYKALDTDKIYVWDVDSSTYKPAGIDEARLLAIESKNTEQDGRLTDVENEIDAEIIIRDLVDANLQSQITTEKNRNDTQDWQIADKVDKPTTDGTWSLQKLGSVFTWVSGVVQNIANTDLSNISARIFTQGNTFVWDTVGFKYSLKNIEESIDIASVLVRNSAQEVESATVVELLVENGTTGVITSANLDIIYPTADIGFEVICPSINTVNYPNGLIYKKYSIGWKAIKLDNV